VDFSGVSNMAPNEYNAFMVGVKPKTLKALQNQLQFSSFKPGYTPKPFGTQAALPPVLQYGYNIPGLGG
jgi:hypothetical protein